MISSDTMYGDSSLWRGFASNTWPSNSLSLAAFLAPNVGSRLPRGLALDERAGVERRVSTRRNSSCLVPLLPFTGPTCPSGTYSNHPREGPAVCNCRSRLSRSIYLSSRSWESQGDFDFSEKKQKSVGKVNKIPWAG